MLCGSAQLFLMCSAVSHQGPAGLVLMIGTWQQAEVVLQTVEPVDTVDTLQMRHSRKLEEVLRDC